MKEKNILLASKHKKELAIAPVFEKAGFTITPAEGLDTDQLGTFDGEVERLQDPLSTAQQKCEAASELFPNAEFILASEGSFGPHPLMGLIVANEEWLVLRNVKEDYEIWSKAISTHTNFNQAEIADEQELIAFAEEAQFPSHALILSDPEKTCFYKGIVDEAELRRTFKKLQSENTSVVVQTDMRACFNPTRMKVIEEAAINLLEKYQHQCPACKTPGFSIQEVIGGLPCEQCGQATRSTLKHIYQCQKCSHTETVEYPKGKKFEDPMYCDSCNP